MYNMQPNNKITKKPKLIRNVNDELWTKTVKRARRVEGLQVHELINKLFTRYNDELDVLEDAVDKEFASRK